MMKLNINKSMISPNCQMKSLVNNTRYTTFDYKEQLKQLRVSGIIKTMHPCHFLL